MASDPITVKESIAVQEESKGAPVLMNAASKANQTCYDDVWKLVATDAYSFDELKEKIDTDEQYPFLLLSALARSGRSPSPADDRLMRYILGHPNFLIRYTSMSDRARTISTLYFAYKTNLSVQIQKVAQAMGYPVLAKLKHDAPRQINCDQHMKTLHAAGIFTDADIVEVQAESAALIASETLIADENAKKSVASTTTSILCSRCQHEIDSAV